MAGISSPVLSLNFWDVWFSVEAILAGVGWTFGARKNRVCEGRRRDPIGDAA
jgi:hypothetical protein